MADRQTGKKKLYAFAFLSLSHPNKQKPSGVSREEESLIKKKKRKRYFHHRQLAGWTGFARYS
jgi:hypothetical protein